VRCSDRTSDGRILQRAFGGHKWKRLAHVGDRTGLEMIRTLQDRGVHMGLEVYMECTVTRLFLDGGRIAGAIAYWRESGKIVVFRAPAVVLATGGVGKAYKVTSNSWEYTADGQALAYEAGAELIDMEFVQFHPTGMVWPPGVMGLLVTEGVRGEGGILRNSKGERFMWKYLPEARKHEYAADEAEARRWLDASVEGKQTDARRPPELSTRDNVSRAIYTEVKEGRGTPHGGAFPRHQLPAGRARAEEAAVDVPPVHGPGRRRHHEAADGGGADHALHHGRRARESRHRGRHRARAVRCGRGGGRAPRREPPRRQLALGPGGVRAARGARRPRPTRAGSRATGPASLKARSRPR
jgi:hypothetical protein